MNGRRNTICRIIRIAAIIAAMSPERLVSKTCRLHSAFLIFIEAMEMTFTRITSLMMR
jgi:hypothetical protein